MQVEKYLGAPAKTFAKDLYHETSEDNIFNGAAALAYYLFLSIFPAMIALLSVIPYLPIDNLHQEIMTTISQILPRQSASLFSGVVSQVTSHRNSGLLSFGIIAAIWASSTGLYAIMQQLNRTYDVRETRPFWKARGTAILMTLVFGVIILSSFALIVFGDYLEKYLANHLGFESALITAFQVFRWVVLGLLLLLGFSVIYYYGPNVEQKFKFITIGSVFGVILFVATALLFQAYVNHFGNYSAMYGSLGAVIVLMLFLYISGLVVLLGSEINALYEHYHPSGKKKGERREPSGTRTFSRPQPV